MFHLGPKLLVVFYRFWQTKYKNDYYYAGKEKIDTKIPSLVNVNLYYIIVCNFRFSSVSTT